MAATTTTSSSPSPSSPIPTTNPNPNLEGTLTLALPAPTAPTTASNKPPPPPSSSSTRRFPPPCWTHEETLALIDAYREKWYALRRGNLRATHWQEVTDAVAQKTQHLLSAGAIPKTSVQCRHKIEKLRKRYRAERQRSIRLDPNSPPQSTWVYFRKMDAMDLGAAVAAAASKNAPPVAAKTSSESSEEESSSSESDDDDEEENDSGGVDHLMANGGRVGGGGSGGLRFKIPKFGQGKSDVHLDSNGRRYVGGYRDFGVEEMKRGSDDKRRKEEKEEDEGRNAMREIAAAVRMLGDGFMRMERMKMDMSREFEKVRMEMELKRTEMILDSHQRIIDAFVKGIVGKKKRKRTKIAPQL